MNKGCRSSDGGCCVLADKRLHGEAVCQVAVWAVFHPVLRRDSVRRTGFIHPGRTAAFIRISPCILPKMIGECRCGAFSRSTSKNPSTFCWKRLTQTMIASNAVSNLQCCEGGVESNQSCESERCWRLSPHNPKPANGKAKTSATGEELLELPEMGLATCEPRLVMVL